MTAPLPSMAIGLEMAGRALGPYQLLSAPANVYVHPPAREMVCAPGSPFAMATSLTKSDGEHPTESVELAGTASTAPRSRFAPWGRVTPRSSTVGGPVVGPDRKSACRERV